MCDTAHQVIIQRANMSLTKKKTKENKIEKKYMKTWWFFKQ